eukprot:628947-Rhodomonas_salina.1
MDDGHVNLCQYDIRRRSTRPDTALYHSACQYRTQRSTTAEVSTGHCVVQHPMSVPDTAQYNSLRQYRTSRKLVVPVAAELAGSQGLVGSPPTFTARFAW